MSLSKRFSTTFSGMPNVRFGSRAEVVGMSELRPMLRAKQTNDPLVLPLPSIQRPLRLGKVEALEQLLVGLIVLKFGGNRPSHVVKDRQLDNLCQRTLSVDHSLNDLDQGFAVALDTMKIEVGHVLIEGIFGLGRKDNTFRFFIEILTTTDGVRPTQPHLHWQRRWGPSELCSGVRLFEGGVALSVQS